MDDNLLQAVEAQVEEWHMGAQRSKERITYRSSYYEGFRNGEINAWEKVLALIKLGEVNNGQ